MHFSFPLHCAYSPRQRLFVAVNNFADNSLFKRYPLGFEDLLYSSCIYLTIFVHLEDVAAEYGERSDHGCFFVDNVNICDSFA